MKQRKPAAKRERPVEVMPDGTLRPLTRKEYDIGLTIAGHLFMTLAVFLGVCMMYIIIKIMWHCK